MKCQLFWFVFLKTTLDPKLALVLGKRKTSGCFHPEPPQEHKHPPQQHTRDLEYEIQSLLEVAWLLQPAVCKAWVACDAPKQVQQFLYQKGVMLRRRAHVGDEGDSIQQTRLLKPAKWKTTRDKPTASSEESGRATGTALGQGSSCSGPRLKAFPQSKARTVPREEAVGVRDF